jgi:hypothetical protein
MPVEWTDPPPRVTRQMMEWQQIADELRSRPGTWALIARGKSPETSTRIKNGALAPFRPAGSFEARTGARNGEKNRVDIYARYVGDGRE